MNFLNIGNKFSDPEKSEVVILAIPYEMAMSYISGCSKGPESIISASAFVELYDEEYGVKPHTVGIFTKYVEGFTSNHSGNLDMIGKEFAKYYNFGKFVIALGGEHSISIGIVKALCKKIDNFSVIQFDAHADFRSYYKKSHESHACVMRRIYEMVDSTMSVGVRSLSEDEISFVREKSINLIWARELYEMDISEAVDKIVKNTKDDAYITIDVDFFSQDVISETGTPEPGGLDWYRSLSILKGVFESKNVIGLDIVELIGSGKYSYSAFSTALLVRKLIGYKFFSKRINTNSQ